MLGMSEANQQSQANYKSFSEENRHYLKVFIQTYHNLPILWDTTLRDYSNRDKRAEAYEQLVPIYKYLKRDANLQDVKKKINTLRTNYRKELKMIESSRRQGNNYQPRCWTFYELEFLRNAEKFLAIDPNFIKNETSNNSTTSPFGAFNEATHQGNFLEISANGMRMNNGNSPPISITQMFQRSFGQNNAAAPTQKSQTSPLADLNESLQNENNVNGLLYTPEQQLRSNSESHKRPKLSSACTCNVSHYPEEESVTRTWAHKLRRLPRDQRLFAEKFVNDILFEAESGTLHRGSMQLNAFEPYVRFEESQADDNASNTSHDKSQSPQLPLLNSSTAVGTVPDRHLTNSNVLPDRQASLETQENSTCIESDNSKGHNSAFNSYKFMQSGD